MLGKISTQKIVSRPILLKNVFLDPLPELCPIFALPHYSAVLMVLLSATFLRSKLNSQFSERRSHNCPAVFFNVMSRFGLRSNPHPSTGNITVMKWSDDATTEVGIGKMEQRALVAFVLVPTKIS